MVFQRNFLFSFFTGFVENCYHTSVQVSDVHLASNNELYLDNLLECLMRMIYIFYGGENTVKFTKK